jgi:hypothetical protein
MCGPTKVCACGRSFTRAQWNALTYAGKQHVPAAIGEPAMDLEFRTCQCGSTITIDLLAPGAPAEETRP